MTAEKPASPKSSILGISHIVQEVPDLDKAVSFYERILGFKVTRRNTSNEFKRSASLSIPSGQWLLLGEAPIRNDAKSTAAHQAYAVDPDKRERILSKLKAEGVTIHTYAEDKPSESQDGLYFDDPFGNRVQIVVSKQLTPDKPIAIDHAGFEINDILWAEEFYGLWLGLPIEHRVGWNTADYLKAKERGAEGISLFMPGSRRSDKRQSVYEKERETIRPNPQLYFKAGAQNGLSVYLAPKHYQALPEDIFRAGPRVALKVTDDGLEEFAQRLKQRGTNFEGPVEHEQGSPLKVSLYIRDPGGNFLELAVVR